MQAGTERKWSVRKESYLQKPQEVEIHAVKNGTDVILRKNIIQAIRRDEDTEETVYVTSIVFEPEPELNENQPSDKYVSQYPLEDILDKFGCYCGDNYEKENEEDPVNSYVEFVSDNLEEIENLLTIIGKHVYNKVDGEYVKLVIE